MNLTFTFLGPSLPPGPSAAIGPSLPPPDPLEPSKDLENGAKIINEASDDKDSTKGPNLLNLGAYGSDSDSQEEDSATNSKKDSQPSKPGPEGDKGPSLLPRLRGDDAGSGSDSQMPVLEDELEAKDTDAVPDLATEVAATKSPQSDTDLPPHLSVEGRPDIKDIFL